MARPVVGTDVGGIPEVIVDRVTGRVVPARDPEALADVLNELLDDPQQRQSLGRQAALVAARSYGLDVMCGRMESIYDRYLPAPH